jgi:uncharacterized membrane protein YphA (DoxX/SURF4 family)
MMKSPGSAGRPLLLIGRVILAGIFLVAAYAKMKPQAGMPWTIGSVRVSLAMFAMGVDSYQMLPAWAVNAVAFLLPPFELFLGLWLLSGVALRFSSLLASLMIVGFIAAMWSAYERGLTINCGCFGPGELVGPRTLIRDGLEYLPLAFAVTIGAFLMPRKPHTEKPAIVSSTAERAG